MSSVNAVRWWPPIAVLAMVLLGLAVGSGSTAVDDWFVRAGKAHPDLGWLLFFTDPVTVFVLLIAALAVALLRRRWRLAAAMVVTPVVALVAVRVLKPMFGRTKGQYETLAYPSGHTTLTVVVLGLVVLVCGCALWAVAGAVVAAVLGLLGQAFTYHYFTDTIGGVLLATALVCLAAWAAAELDRCQPDCDLRHSGG